MSTINTWANLVGFKTIDSKTYRGSISSLNLESVQKALTDMEFSCVCRKKGFEIWVTENDIDVVLINHS